ncbi:unnamed protein product [Sphagnum balticum]
MYNYFRWFPMGQHNPLETRVIIFTNFRESVKDILETLNKIHHVVKATEFIGQTSGKSSKGQTQKMQQAVLQVWWLKAIHLVLGNVLVMQIFQSTCKSKILCWWLQHNSGHIHS